MCDIDVFENLRPNCTTDVHCGQCQKENAARGYGWLGVREGPVVGRVAIHAGVARGRAVQTLLPAEVGSMADEVRDPSPLVAHLLEVLAAVDVVEGVNPEVRERCLDA